MASNFKLPPSAQDPIAQVYMSFKARRTGPRLGDEIWVCTFLERDLVTLVCRNRTFGSEEKVRELIARTRTPLTLEVRHGFSMGHGGITLNLTDEQYAKLKA